MSIVVAAMIGSVITGKVTNKWGKRQACLGSLLFHSSRFGRYGFVDDVCKLLSHGCRSVYLWFGGGHGIARHAKLGHGTRSQSTSRRRSYSHFYFPAAGVSFGNRNSWSPTESWYTATCKGTTAEGFASISLAFETAHGQDAMQAQALRSAASSAYAYAILIAFCVTAALCSFWWQDLSHIYRN